MNQDLRHSLRSLVDLGENGATPADVATHRALGRVGSARRRRPVVVAGLTGLGVLTAGAAAALGYSFLQDDDAAPFPDRLTPETSMPSSAPVSITCGAGIGDLVATEEPLALGSAAANAANSTPVTLTAETGTGLEPYLRNTSTEPVTLTTTQDTGAFLVKDGHVVAIPASPTEPTEAPTDVTLAPDGTQTLPDDGMVPCPDSSGATPTSIPAGDYDAYGVATVSIDGTPETLEVVGGPWPVRVETALEPPAPEPDALPAANPDAVFPECGAVVEAPTGIQAITLLALEAPAPFGVPDASAPLAATQPISAVNEELYAGYGDASIPVLVAVKDGVVVGSYTADPAEVYIEMYGDGGVFPITPGTVETTLCSSPGTPLPEGRYSIWAAQDFTFSYVYYFRDEANPERVLEDPVTPNVPYRALSQVASLWMDGAGQSVGNPGLQPGWPEAVPLDVAFAPGSSDLQTIVWLAISPEYHYYPDAALVPGQNRLLDLGYTETKVPFSCQAGLEAIGVDLKALERGHGYGTALVFPSAAEAQTFVDLWEPLYGPVLGTVTGGIGVRFGSNIVGWDDVSC